MSEERIDRRTMPRERPGYCRAFVLREDEWVQCTSRPVRNGTCALHDLHQQPAKFQEEG